MSPLSPSSTRLTRNNFDLLRLVAASAVCLAHAHALSGYEDLAWLPKVFSSEVAVKAFFVVSGFLIFMSYERSSSLGSYFLKRVRRIYPAYFTVVMLCAILLVGVSTLPISGYFSVAWLKYLLANLTFLNFLHPGLPGVFETSPFPVVNGALWTLKIEVMFYLSVPALVWLCRRFGYLLVLVLCYFASTAYASWATELAVQKQSMLYQELARQLPGQLSYFVSGAFFYYFLPWFERYYRYCLVGAVAVLYFFPAQLVEPFALATIVVYFALFFYMGNVGKYGDFSYGIYIVHFPIIQVLFSLCMFKERPYEFLALVCLTTLIAGIAMWHLVEKHFLQRDSHYLAAAETGTKP